MNKIAKKNYKPAKQHAVISSGEIIKMLRELKGWTQEELSIKCGIKATNISLLEHDKLEIGKKRALQLALAFDIHPAIIMFPEYESREILKAA